jgi:hypothetical protein
MGGLQLYELVSGCGRLSGLGPHALFTLNTHCGFAARDAGNSATEKLKARTFFDFAAYLQTERFYNLDRRTLEIG